MNCDDLQHLADEYLTGRLTDVETAAAEAHLSQCDDCAEMVEAATELRRQAARLARSIDPPRDLWPGIEARIAAGRVTRGRFGRRALLAAAAAVLLVSSVLTAYYLGRQQGVSKPGITASPRPAASDVLRASFAEIGVHDYEATREQLLEILDRREGEIAPETMQVVRKNLSLIDEAMDEIAEALGNDPGNELLIRQLASAYRLQVDLLGRAANLPSEV